MSPIAMVRSASSFSLNTAAAAREDVVRDLRLGHASHGFRPRQSRPFPLTEEGAGLMPCLHQGELLDRHAFLRELSGVHVRAIRTAVDLADAQVHKLDENGLEARLH